MHSAVYQSPVPKISIILPTYNRGPFLTQALASIRSQTFADWELIIVDDGSTDDTGKLIKQYLSDLHQPYRYVCQENQGAYGARNSGLELARGQYVAFFDSDDLWLPHRLQRCAGALDANRNVDWVFGACQMVEHHSDRELAPTTFYVDGKPRPFLKLEHTTVGDLKIINDRKALRCALLHGLFCGLQNSVFRRSVMAERRFDTARRTRLKTKSSLQER